MDNEQSSASPTIRPVGGATAPHHALPSPTTPPSLSPPGDRPTVRPWSPTQTHRGSREGRRDGSCRSRVPFFPVSSACCPLVPGIHAFPPSHWLDLSPGSLVTHAHSWSFSRKRWPGSTPALHGASSSREEILREIARISTVFRPTSFDRAGNYWFSREKTVQGVVEGRMVANLYAENTEFYRANRPSGGNWKLDYSGNKTRCSYTALLLHWVSSSGLRNTDSRIALGGSAKYAWITLDRLSIHSI